MSNRKDRSTTPDEVLRRMAAPNHPGVYVLGCVSSPLTFHSQQQRACNLIWALCTAGDLVPGKSVAVIGGGLAGVTVAAAAAAKGCRVSILERKRQLLHLQRGGLSHRYVHPNVYDWPVQGWDAPKTDLPFLNWYAGTADQVAAQVLAGWDQFVGVKRVTVLPEREVIEPLHQKEGKWQITLGQGSRPVMTSGYDVVILSVGFGTERELDDVKSSLYWNKDDLDEADKTNSRERKRILVAGCGDGGLIDVLRARIYDFKHAELARTLLSPSALGGVAGRLQEIDSEAWSMKLGRGAEPEAVVADAIAEFMWEKYLDLKLPQQVIDGLTSQHRQREDTEVVLTDRRTGPLGLTSSALNRFAVFLLMEHGPAGRLSYKRAEIGNGVITPNGKRFTVRWSGSDRKEDFDRIVVRLGAVAALGASFQSIYQAVKEDSPASPEEDGTRHRLWPEGFFGELNTGGRRPHLTRSGRRCRRRRDHGPAVSPGRYNGCGARSGSERPGGAGCHRPHRQREAEPPSRRAGGTSK